MFLLQLVTDTLAAVPTPQTGAELLTYLVSLGVGSVIGGSAKFADKTVDVFAKLAEPVKLAIIAVLSFLSVKLEVLLGVQLPDNPLAWSPEIVNTVLTAATALGLRVVSTKKPTA